MLTAHKLYDDPGFAPKNDEKKMKKKCTVNVSTVILPFHFTLTREEDSTHSNSISQKLEGEEQLANYALIYAKKNK